MTNLHEPVYLRFRGRTRRLPLLAIATALRRDASGAIEALEILINGPPETRPDGPCSPPPIPGEGGKGGGERSGTLGPGTFEQNLEERSERERSDGHARETMEPEAFARFLATQLGDERNLAAIRRLVARYPRDVLGQALRLTLEVPPERVRSSRGAIFTGIVRKLAAENVGPPPP